MCCVSWREKRMHLQQQQQQQKMCTTEIIHFLYAIVSTLKIISVVASAIVQEGILNFNLR
jgi:hypothetical protein